ncbi:hypothetical protein [Cupriavidus pinatubonensis]|uniref:Secreted protein n=1 Tax=Cupriavidus pinatubonensis TaxID=248026 RepID=A0ABN7ZT03_9BURK|nr:hypothetical protein [Cupriavidus pinatubonensis]CAG9187042.1 hypothetical protein LMG23994_06523 [Cupriavidus pinatubonensis]
MSVSRFAKLMVMLCGIAGTPALAVSFVIVNGKLVKTDLTTPSNPTDRAECEVYRTESAVVVQALNDAHNTCLNRNYGATPGHRCSFMTCEQLHVARETAQHDSSEGYRACLHKMRWKNQQATREIVSNDEQKMADGPRAAVQQLIQDAMTDAFAKTFGLPSDLVKDSVSYAQKTAELAGMTSTILTRCDRTAKTSEDRHLCAQTVRQSLNDLSLHVPLDWPRDPAVALIQRAMLEKLVEIQDDALRQLDGATKDMQRVSAAPPRTPAGCAKLDSLDRTDFANDHPDEFEALVARCDSK